MSTRGLVALLLVIFLVTKLRERAPRAQKSLLSPGSSSVPLSYISGVLNFLDGRDAVRRACHRYGNQLFTFPQLGLWVVLAHAKSHVRDICNAPEDVLSMQAAAEELLQLSKIVGPQFCNETYHIHAIRTSLNLNLARLLPMLLDEIARAFEDSINTHLVDDGWTSLKASDLFSRMICRASNRAFVGLPLCRNTEYIDLASQFASHVFSAGTVIKMLIPSSLRGFTGGLFRSVHRHHCRMLRLVEPLVEKRRHERMLCKEPPTEDMIGWLLDAAPDSNEQSAASVAMRLLNVNFVALHTTTKVFIHTLYYVAANPEIVPALREEAELHLGRQSTETWSKEALGRCVKMDSLFKETLRLKVFSSMTLPRLAVKDFTFTDGTKLSAGSYVATAADVLQREAKVYPEPDEFKPFRFVTPTATSVEQEAFNGWPNRMTSSTENFLAFGGGRHVCPGRFFASTELKIFMAYLVLNYDMKMPQDGVRPPDEWLGPMSNPSTRARGSNAIDGDQKVRIDSAVDECVLSRGKEYPPAEAFEWRWLSKGRSDSSTQQVPFQDRSFLIEVLGILLCCKRQSICGADPTLGRGSYEHVGNLRYTGRKAENQDSEHYRTIVYCREF
ncbi:hypothetical protein PM082_019297 [Marasmius tenuissimus]|nr:hypothetical protein PM082_019297 [Marasmius tenuissimus]